MAVNFCVLAVIFLSPLKGQWISPITPLLPKSDCEMSIGYHEDIISILGGDQSNFDVIEYNISNNSFNHFDDIIPTTARVLGVCQYWTQLNNIVYMIDGSGNSINTYDLSNKLFIVNWINISISVFYDGCLASTNHTLYAIGLNHALQIYDITNMSWSLGATLNTLRQQFACIACSKYDTLYAIGGGDGNRILNTVEWISTINIEINEWQYTSDNLDTPLSFGRAVIHEKYIYIIGGFIDEGITNHDVNVIDMSTNNIFLMEGRLVYNVAAVSSIAIYDRIFVFGGLIDNDQVIDQWQYYTFNSRSSLDMNDMSWLLILGIIIAIILILCCIVGVIIQRKIKQNDPLRRQLSEDVSMEGMFGK